MTTIKTSDFGQTKDGQKVTAFDLDNGNGLTMRALDYGGIIQKLFVPDKNGKPIDIVLGYDDVASYEIGTCFYGAIIGRCANRIGDNRFMLDGREIVLPPNSGETNHLHGCFHHRVFEAHEDNGALVLKYFSPDGEDGYPGNVNVEVRYLLTEDNSLELLYEATTDAPTPVNLTNHTYFNLKGQDGSTIFDHKVWLNSSAFTEYTESMAQTGNIIPVEGTPLDFRKEELIGARYEDEYPQLRITSGYDHNMILDGEEGAMKLIGTVKCDVTGITIEASTTEPAVQFYTSNFVGYDVVKSGKGGVKYPNNGGVCLEAQHYPDAVNHPNFPSVILRPGEVYKQRTVYKFSR